MITASDGRVWSLVTDLRGLAAFCNDPECVDQERVTTLAHIIGHLVERSVSAWRLVLLADWEDPRVRLGRVARIDKLAALSEALAKLGLWSISLCVNVRAWAAAGPAELGWEAILRSRYPHAGVGRERTHRILAVDDLRREQPWLTEAWRQFLSVVGVGLPGLTVAVLRSGLVFDRVVDAYCQTIRLAIELLEREALQAVSRRRAAHWRDLCVDSNKPTTDAAMRARDRRYAGWPVPDEKIRFRPALGSDVDSKIEQNVFGEDEDTYIKAWCQTDERIYEYKRGIARREYVGGSPTDTPASPPDFTHAFGSAQVRRVYNALAFANRTGRILNAQLTVSWYLLDRFDLDGQWQCFGTFYHNLKQWFRDLKAELVPDAADRRPWIVYVHENPGGARLHTHFGLVVPEPVRNQFNDSARGILERAAHVKIGDRNMAKLVRLRVRRANRHACVGQWFWFHYMLKGANHSEIVAKDGENGSYSLGDVMAYRYQDPGPMGSWRRIGVTEAMRPKAQTAFRDDRGQRFDSIWEQQIGAGRIDVRALYSDRYLAQWEGHDDAAIVTAAPPAVRDLDHDDHPLESLIMRPGGF